MMDRSPQAKHLISPSEKINKLRNYMNGGRRGRRRRMDIGICIFLSFECCCKITKHLFSFFNDYFIYFPSQIPPFQT